jgi:hypothetical protein
MTLRKCTNSNEKGLKQPKERGIAVARRLRNRKVINLKELQAEKGRRGMEVHL